MGKEHDLLLAVKEQDLHAVHRILSKCRNKAKLLGSSKRINVNLQDQDGMAALHQAALVGNTNIMQALLENGIMVDIKDNKGMRPLHYASWQGKEAPVNLLLQWGSSANEPANDGETPLHLACQHGHNEVVNLLLQHKGDPTIFNRNYKTPLDLACEFGRYQVVEVLLLSNLCGRLLYHCENDLADNHRTTCLHLAAKNGHGNIIKLLLQFGVDINRQTHQGTCLHEAALYGKTDVVKLLLDCGVDVNRPNSYDQTALDIVNQFTGSRAGKELKQLLKDLDQQLNGDSDVYNASYKVIARASKDHYHIYDQSALAFKEGDYISVLEQRSDGIWKGQIVHERGNLSQPGYFPASAVVLVDRQALSSAGLSLPGMTSARRVMAPQVPDLLNPSLAPVVGGDRSPYNSVGMDESFPPPPSPLVKPKGSPSRDSDRDSGISPQQHYPPHGFPGQAYYPQQPSPTSPEQHDWYARHVLLDSDVRSHSPSRDSPGSSNRNSAASSGSGGYLPAQGFLNQASQHRLSGQSYESGVSGVSAVSSSRQSYHSNSSSSLGSLDRLEESGYSSTVNVHELFQQGVPQDTEVLRCWLADLRFEEYYSLFVQAGYDMPTISRMTPEDLTAIGITKPAHRKRLKAEISKLQISDGIPDYKPQDVEQWLYQLNLSLYLDCITSQGYAQIDDVTEITWEDLEEIGVQKLGHQKKIMLAVERLKRIESGSRRLSTLERKSSVELLEPPSSYPTPVWLKDRSGAVSEVPPVNLTTPKLSPSGDDISAPELRTFQQFPRPEDSGASQPDVVAIQVKRTASRSNSIDESHREVIYQSFQGPFADGPRGEGDPGGDRSADEMDGSSTLRRPSAKVSPRIAPKPKPVAMIQAKTKRGSRDFSSLEPAKFSSQGDRVLGSPGYSGTLGRKASFNKAEAIYDMPGELTIKIPQGDAPEKQSPSNFYAVSPVGKGAGRKAPPPPPKRTNSIKSDINLLHHKTLKKVDPPTVPAPAPPGARQIPGSPSRQPAVPRAESQESIAESLPAPPLDYSPPQMDEFPPPPPPISAPSPVPLDLGPTEAPNPLTDAIQQLERQAQSPCSTLKKPKNKIKVDRGWKSDSDSDSGDSGFGAKRNDSMASIASTESNTLPFANENVGTIKQRAPAAKPSILTVADEESGDREVDTTLFDDGMSTIRRHPKAEGATAHPTAEVSPQPRGAECRKVPPPTPKRRDSIKSQADVESSSLEGSPKKGANNETTDVLNDIGNMLQDLTDELDAMLEFEL